ncbi:iron ABC transporter permease [uncultured Bacteroides sp.]|uniref:FecCD family ABC transporter permease n=1 Tax=uncultured Bacteroides sp. TaxID=162156 RepID=UPI002AAA95D3|nr:iron ABC transporter permease [uncultured Bacteroides sp.]
MNKSYSISILLLFMLLFLFIFLSLKIGQLNISFSEIFEALQKKDNSLIRDVIVNLRLPRILFAALTGCGLALCGYVMQASIQNVLADPYILGVSSGAALGATFAILVDFPFSHHNLPQEITISAWAFIGAISAITIANIIAGYKRKQTNTRLILAGVIVNVLCTAISNMLIYLANDVEGIRSITFWTMGSLANISWLQVVILAVFLLFSILYFFTQYRTLNILSLGEETASTLGINIYRKRKVYILIVTILTGIMVAQCGIIGFVGLIVPHAVRAICKTANSNILPLVLLSGSIFLVLVDLLSRILIEHQEVPIGIITSIIGAPIFLLIFLKQNYGS